MSAVLAASDLRLLWKGRHAKDPAMRCSVRAWLKRAIAALRAARGL